MVQLMNKAFFCLCRPVFFDGDAVTYQGFSFENEISRAAGIGTSCHGAANKLCKSGIGGWDLKNSWFAKQTPSLHLHIFPIFIITPF